MAFLVSIWLYTKCVAILSHYPFVQGDVAVIKVLLKEGADPSQAGRHVLPPLHLAAMMGNEAAVRALLDAGAPLYTPDFVKFTPLHCATYSAHENVRSLPSIEAL